MSKVNRPGGKGSKRIDPQIGEDKMQDNWDRIFGKKRFHGRDKPKSDSPNKLSR